MRLVLLGDLHFYQLGVWPWQLLSKRLLGQMNLWINRRRHFRPSLWPLIADRVRELAPDGLLGSGDFTTTALPGEFRQASEAWGGLIESLTLPAGAHVVPGNHDRYTFASKRQRFFEQGFGAWTSDSWPAVWRLDEEVHVIGLDPTRPNGFNASGELGEDQLARLKETLNDMPATAVVMVLCHYPIGTPPDLPEEAVGHGLQDKAALMKLMADSGLEITYVHGHIHWPWIWKPPAAPNVTTVNVGAPMLMGSRYPRGQGLVELVVKKRQVHVTRHVLDSAGVWSSHDETLAG
ncbi:MAG: 3',5'-cyclic AMP phosphodiesterase CpdA [Verrucomicrobiales bacterium]|jgi:3',5'-cyclic AMP phosphodiesterase CpdA